MRALRLPPQYVGLTSIILWSCVLCMGLGWGEKTFAQGMSSGGSDRSNLPPAPQNHVLDDAELFRENPETLAEVEQSLHRMEMEYGYPVYLAIYYSVYDGNLQARADNLYNSWIGESNRGMVLVYQLDPVVSGYNPSVSFFKGSGLNSGLSTETEQRLISGQQVDVMLARVFENLKEERTDHIPYISSLIYGLEGEISEYHAIPTASWSDKDNLKLMVVFLGIIAGLALLGMLLWKLFSNADAKSNKSHYFPEVRVGRRLDAPFGGGWVSEKTFVPASSRR